LLLGTKGSEINQVLIHKKGPDKSGPFFIKPFS